MYVAVGRPCLNTILFGVDGLGAVSRKTLSQKTNTNVLSACLRCNKTVDEVGGSDHWAYRKIITRPGGQAIQFKGYAREYSFPTSNQLTQILEMRGHAWLGLAFTWILGLPLR